MVHCVLTMAEIWRLVYRAFALLELFNLMPHDFLVHINFFCNRSWWRNDRGSHFLCNCPTFWSEKVSKVVCVGRHDPLGFPGHGRRVICTSLHGHGLRHRHICPCPWFTKSSKRSPWEVDSFKLSDHGHAIIHWMTLVMAMVSPMNRESWRGLPFIELYMVFFLWFIGA